MKQKYLTKDEILVYMKKLYQQAGATGILSRSDVEFNEENMQVKRPAKEGTGQMSEEEYSYAMEEDFSIGGSEVDLNNAQKSYQMTSGEFDESDKQNFADIKTSLRKGTKK